MRRSIPVAAAAIGAGATAVVVGVTALQAPAGASAAGASAGGGHRHHNQPAATHHLTGNAVGLTDRGVLVSFSLLLPSLPRTIGSVTGLSGDTKLVGIDYRVQDRKLYGVGNAGGVYTISTTSARASKVNTLTVPLSGKKFGVDFNPAADRLRIISDTGQNLRHDVNPGGTTLVDGTLTVPPATTAATGVTGAAYTNNDLDADTATTLFDLDTAADQIVLQSPANSGQLAATGKLGVDAGSDAGFDIRTQVRGGAAVDNSGYATLSVGGTYRLYSVSLLTGEVTARGSFPGKLQVTDLALTL